MGIFIELGKYSKRVPMKANLNMAEKAASTFSTAVLNSIAGISSI